MAEQMHAPAASLSFEWDFNHKIPVVFALTLPIIGDIELKHRA